MLLRTRVRVVVTSRARGNSSGGGKQSAGITHVRSAHRTLAAVCVYEILSRYLRAAPRATRVSARGPGRGAARRQEIRGIVQWERQRSSPPRRASPPEHVGEADGDDGREDWRSAGASPPTEASPQTPSSCSCIYVTRQGYPAGVVAATTTTTGAARVPPGEQRTTSAASVAQQDAPEAPNRDTTE